jgi:hypothetical protein
VLRNFGWAVEPHFAIFPLRNHTRPLAVPLPVSLTAPSVGVRGVTVNYNFDDTLERMLLAGARLAGLIKDPSVS